ncbi:MAG: DUF4129 domain-containing protein [Thermoguttaceae bacterium]
MSTRYDKTLADYLVIAVSPALIMTLIGSLVYFLLEVFYQGNFTARLYYLLTLFIFAAVLIGRIAIEEGSERAALFALPLGLAILVAINRFVEFHGAIPTSLSTIINCGLIGLIWWCAHKLTWDCTMIDETEPSSGEGLLDAAGLGKRTKAAPRGAGPKSTRRSSNSAVPAARAGESSAPQAVRGQVPSDNRDNPETNPGRGDPRPPGRWNNWRQPHGKPHAPGVWIVYFSLAALPLFGLGQLAIPAAQLGRRRYAFCLLAIYVASGLGLLLTTSFLGLRRYLRQRRLPMPMLMANTWIVLGCLLIFAVMGLALFVPRPSAEYAISQIPSVMGSPDQKPSKFGAGPDGVKGDEPGRHSSDQKQGKAAAGHGDATNPNGPPSEKRGSSQPAKSGAAGEKAQRQSRGDAKEPASRDGPRRSSPPRRQPAGEDRNNPSHDSPSRGEKSETSAKAEKPRETDSHPPGENATANRPPDLTPPTMPDVSSVFTALLPLLQIVFYAVVVGLGIYWAWRRRAELLAALRDLLSGLSSFWEGLLHRRRKTAQPPAEGTSGPAPLRPFADFVDPFATGMADRLSADQLVQYTFEALEAWARESGCPRIPEQTPHEFARNTGRREESLRHPAIRLADLYCEAAYAPGRLQISNMQPLKELWQSLRAVYAGDLQGRL